MIIVIVAYEYVSVIRAIKQTSMVVAVEKKKTLRNGRCTRLFILLCMAGF